MSFILNAAVTPEKIVEYIKMQVADALLNENLFPDDPPDNASTILFALGLLSVVPPVPVNQNALKRTLSYLQRIYARRANDGFWYNEIAYQYKRYRSVFEVSYNLPSASPLGNPYDEIAKAAARSLGFEDDGVKLFHLTVWINVYCNDARDMFYREKITQPEKPLPSYASCYSFVSKHVNNTVTDPTFFTDLPPANATQVLTALYMVVAIYHPTQSSSLLHGTLAYANKLLRDNGFSPVFFEQMMQLIERFMLVYTTTQEKNARKADINTFNALAEDAVRATGLYPDVLFQFNLSGYFPVLIVDAKETLFS